MTVYTNVAQKATSIDTTAGYDGGSGGNCFRDGSIAACGYSTAKSIWSIAYRFSSYQCIGKVRYYNAARGGRNNRFSIEYSDDYVTWTAVTTITSVTDGAVFVDGTYADSTCVDGWNGVIFSPSSHLNWRIVFTTFCAGGDNNCGVNELEMYSAIINYNIASLAVTANHAGDAYCDLTKLRNGLVDVCGALSGDKSQWSVGYNFSSPKNIGQVRWYSLADSGRNLRYHIEYSSDNSTWSSVLTAYAVTDNSSLYGDGISAVATDADGWNGIVFQPLYYQYWRIVFSTFSVAGDGNCGVAELEMYSSGIPTYSHSGDYTFVTYTGIQSTMWIPPPGVNVVQYLIIGGGGSGGTGHACGGGGAGGLLTGTVRVTPGTPIVVAVGAGGIPPIAAATSVTGNPGERSQFSTIIATGGGGGGSFAATVNATKMAGGSGGGAAYDVATGGVKTASPAQGNEGGVGVSGTVRSGGGGGAGQVGQTSGTTGYGGSGGDGINTYSTTFGLTGYLAAGGGGSGNQPSGYMGGAGGSMSVGGDGGANASAAAKPNGDDNTGSGGGGGWYNGVYQPGGYGGTGIVVIKYFTPRIGKRAIVSIASVGESLWNPPNGVTSIDYLAVGGGGSGGMTGAGGGGGGGFWTTTTYGGTETALTVTPGTPIFISVGGGGAGIKQVFDGDNIHGVKGFNSIVGTITSTGGGYGSAGGTTPGGDGGSGGGACYGGGSGNVLGGHTVNGSHGTDGGDCPNAGSNAGCGGGGATASGSARPSQYVGGAGGDGKSCTITGSSVIYAGGGGGGGSGGEGAGGSGGGGAGGHYTVSEPVSGTESTGGGGGGAYSAGISGSGGSGIVIISFIAPESTLLTETIEVWNIPGTYTDGWITPIGIQTIRYLVVGGGGGGGGSSDGGGGGGGGYMTGSGLGVYGNKTIVVGNFGAGGIGDGQAGSVGGNSSFGDAANHLAHGGGGGGGWKTASPNWTAATDGGSGGGAGGVAAGTHGVAYAGEGYDGGHATNYGAGGGGGAGGVGANAVSNIGGNGGNSSSLNDITGTSTYYCAGGGGGGQVTKGSGGTGAGDGGYATTPPTIATGYGCGGGGGQYTQTAAGTNGMIGIVIIRYAPGGNADESGVSFGSFNMFTCGC